MFSFYKYHGAGNDFILIHNFDQRFIGDPKYIHALCNRRTGIGADGLITIQASEEKGIDFSMHYYNADGYEGSMCGNGGRCALAFAKKLNIIHSESIFRATDGLHKGYIITEKGKETEVSLQMIDIENITTFEDGFFLNTGSPHVVKFVHHVENMDVIAEGKRIRNHTQFPEGTNVNFVEIKDNHLFVRTFERGVEDETLSCGTGVTASSIAYAITKPIKKVHIKTLGGTFTVNFLKEGNTFKEVMLQGPTCLVFEGKI